MAEVQEEELPLLQQPQEEDPRSIQRRYRFIALVGACLVQYSFAGKPSVDGALTGFLLWLLGATRLLPFTQVGRLHPLFSAVLAAATAKFSLALERTKRLFTSCRQEPAAVPA